MLQAIITKRPTYCTTITKVRPAYMVEIRGKVHHGPKQIETCHRVADPELQGLCATCARKAGVYASTF